LPVVASALGYRTLIVIPDTQSQEKKDMLRLCGAELVEVARRFLLQSETITSMSEKGWPPQLRKSEPHGVLFADQWNNLDNAKAHYDSTGPRNLGSRPAARSTGSSARSAPRYRWRASAILEGKEQRHRHRLRRSARGCDV